jgi:type III secretion system FlhB-like substrate exporter
MAPDVAADHAAHKDLPVVDDDSRMKVPTEVSEQLKEALANIDLVYHNIFVSMYKILVPIYASIVSTFICVLCVMECF